MSDARDDAETLDRAFSALMNTVPDEERGDDVPHPLKYRYPAMTAAMLRLRPRPHDAAEDAPDPDYGF
jgi:hypothetical protein